jgi:hypothetical protein
LDDQKVTVKASVSHDLTLMAESLPMPLAETADVGLVGEVGV